jgi:uncharacterized protein
MSIYSVLDIRTKLQPIFEKSPVQKAILYGSYATGNADKYSDIDIFIDSNGILNGLNFFGLLEDISSMVDIPVELIEAIDVIPNSRLDDEIKRKGVTISK